MLSALKKSNNEPILIRSTQAAGIVQGTFAGEAGEWGGGGGGGGSTVNKTLRSKTEADQQQKQDRKTHFRTGKGYIAGTAGTI